MKIGCCVSVNEMEKAESIGYDFIEFAVGDVLPDQPVEKWEPLKQRILKNSIRPEAWRCMLPAEIKVVGADVDLQRVHRYLGTAFKRISEVGGRVVVFGSGGARNIPEGFSREKAQRQIREMLLMAGDLALENGLRIAIEPLNSKETNIINSIPEALTYAQPLNHPAVGVLADYYHMDEDHQPLSDLSKAGNLLMHVHVSDALRRYPGNGGYDFQGFFDALRSCGYDGRISIECAWGSDTDFEYRSALQFLRKFTTTSASS